MESEEPDGVQAPEKGILTHDLRRSQVDTSNTYVREFMPRLQSSPGPQPKHAKHGPPLHGARGGLLTAPRGLRCSKAQTRTSLSIFPSPHKPLLWAVGQWATQKSGDAPPCIWEVVYPEQWHLAEWTQAQQSPHCPSSHWTVPWSPSEEGHQRTELTISLGHGESLTVLPPLSSCPKPQVTPHDATPS